MPSKYVAKLKNLAAKGTYQTVKRRYYRKDKGLKFSKIAKDVMFLKSIINAEKKHFEIIEKNGILGQSVGDQGGYFYKDITPIPLQGTSATNRVGASLKIHSSFMQLYLKQQSSTSQPIKGTIYIVECKGRPQVLSTILPAEEFFQNTPFVTPNGYAILDNNSERNQDFYKNFIVHRKKRFFLKSDTASGVPMTLSLKLPMKWNKGKGHHIKFEANTTYTVSSGQLFAFIVVDSGNASTVNTATIDIPIQDTSTGIILDFSCKHFYYDN